MRGDPKPPLTVYDFSPDTSNKCPLEFLSDYKGYIHADTYSGYDELFQREGVIEMGCWAHARRKFNEAMSSRAMEASGIMARIGLVYADTIPSEPLRKVVDYALNQHDALYRYLDDGRLKIDNNTAENAMRPLALGRKNRLFAGS